MKNRGWVIGVIVIVLVVIFGIYYLNRTFFIGNSEPKPLIIGGDKDKGGCLVGAGYSWCESKQKCLRIWEESCAESFCLRENVAGVYNCGDYVKVISSLLGGGATYYSENMSQIVCPVVGPDYISKDCKDIQGLNCSKINC